MSPPVVLSQGGLVNSTVKTSLVLFAVLATAIAAVFWGGGGPAAPATKAPPPPEPGLVTDDQRADYITQHLELVRFEVGADSYVDSEGKTKEVQGLLAVSGEVKNNGSLAIRKLRLSVKPTDQDNKVLGSFMHDITGKRRLEAGASKPFKFTIPDKKGASGELLRTLR